MLIVKGKYLGTKSFSNGKLNIVSILDQNDRFSRILDLADFDNRITGIPVNTDIEVPFNFRQKQDEKSGRTFLNFSVAGEPLVLEA